MHLIRKLKRACRIYRKLKKGSVGKDGKFEAIHLIFASRETREQWFQEVSNKRLKIPNKEVKVILYVEAGSWSQVALEGRPEYF